MTSSSGRISFRSIFLWGFLGFVIAAVVFSFLYTELKNPSKSSLPRLSIVPDITLTERSGAQLPLSDLKGKAWIADFIFTNCGGSCPIMSSTMASFQQQLKDVNNILLVSFTVDPERDTPDVMRDYAEMYKASASRWLFLTGEKQKIDRLTREGFHLAVAADSVRRSNRSFTAQCSFSSTDGGECPVIRLKRREGIREDRRRRAAPGCGEELRQWTLLFSRQ